MITDMPRGFLPNIDPVFKFQDPELAVLDDLGRDLPSLLEDKSFRQLAKEMYIPPLPSGLQDSGIVRLYYVRLGFLASAYINQLGLPRETILPANIAIPLVDACKRINRPPILSYDGYALYNWKRFNTNGAVALGNIDTIQNFVHLYDEHWFILVHVEIEALAANCMNAMLRVRAQKFSPESVDAALADIAKSVWEQVRVLERIPEKMDASLYYKTFRQYIRFFENVVYEGVSNEPMNYRGETGAQSSIMPSLVSFMKVPHKPSTLTNHLSDMRNFMPSEHVSILEEIEKFPSIKPVANKNLFNEVLEGMAAFREVHFRWAQEYINKWVSDPRGTGGTPYMEWLHKLITETRDHKIQ